MSLAYARESASATGTFLFSSGGDLPRALLLETVWNSGTAPIWTPTSGQNEPRSTISLP